MILCASPDPKELHKTIATLEYGAKAKCIVRGPHTPVKEKGFEDSSSAIILGSRIAALDQFIFKLQVENKARERERNEAQKELSKKEEVCNLRQKLAMVERRGSEEEISLKVNERTKTIRSELERKIQECQKMANELVEMERRKMEAKMLQQQQEVEMLRQRLEEIESELRLSRAGTGNSSVEMEGGSFMKKLLETCSDDSDMVKSMDLDKSLDLETNVVCRTDLNGGISGYHFNETPFSFPSLTTVYEEEENENEDEDNDQLDDEEVQKEVVEEKQMIVTPQVAPKDAYNEPEITEESRLLRIQNIFTLCGNYRELNRQPFTSLENVPTTPISLSSKKVDDCYSPEVAPHLSSTPFITVRKALGQ